MRGVRLVVEQRAVGDGDDAGVGVDLETPAGVVGEAVGDIVGGVGIGRQGRDADLVAVRGVLGDAAACGAVAVGDRADIEFVGVGNRDGEGLRIAVAGRIRHPDDQVVAAVRLVVQQRAVGNRNPSVAVDGEAAAGIVQQAMGEGFRRVFRVHRGDRADRIAVAGRLADAVQVERHVGRRFVHVADVDPIAFGRAAAGGIGHAHDDLVAIGGLVVDQRTVGDREPAVAIDGETPAGIVHHLIAVGPAGAVNRDPADRGAVGAVLVDQRVVQADRECGDAIGLRAAGRIRAAVVRLAVRRAFPTAFVGRRVRASGLGFGQVRRVGRRNARDRSILEIGHDLRPGRAVGEPGRSALLPERRPGRCSRTFGLDRLGRQGGRSALRALDRRLSCVVLCRFRLLGKARGVRRGILPCGGAAVLRFDVEVRAEVQVRIDRLALDLDRLAMGLAGTLGSTRDRGTARRALQLQLFDRAVGGLVLVVLLTAGRRVVLRHWA